MKHKIPRMKLAPNNVVKTGIIPLKDPMPVKAAKKKTTERNPYPSKNHFVSLGVSTIDLIPLLKDQIAIGRIVQKFNTLYTILSEPIPNTKNNMLLTKLNTNNENVSR